MDEAAPGFKHSIIEPQIGGGLEFVEGSYHSCYGVHRLKWQVDDDQVTVSVQIPANTTAEIRLSDVKELVQTDDDGNTYSDQSMEVDDPQFPLSIQDLNGHPGITSGTVVLYEWIDDSYQIIDQYDVSFRQVN